MILDNKLELQVGSPTVLRDILRVRVEITLLRRLSSTSSPSVLL
jgi:hypothetical protein